MKLHQSFRWITSVVATLGLFVLGATQADANPIAFAPNLVIGPNVYGQGSDPNDPAFQAPVDYLLETDGVFYEADESGQAPVTMNINKCIVASGSNTCSTGAAVANGDPYSIIAEISIASLVNPLPNEGMLLLLSGVAPIPAYAHDAVSVYTTDPGDVPGMPISQIYTASRVSGSGVTNYYLGLFFPDLNALTLRV
jgi:hypothetical protein